MFNPVCLDAVDARLNTLTDKKVDPLESQAFDPLCRIGVEPVSLNHYL
jgi:hypothetical protein